MRFLTAPILLLSLVAHVSSSTAHTKRLCVVKTRKLKNAEKASLQAESRIQCAVLCLADATCQSVNFERSDGACGLNTKTRKWAPGADFVDDPATEYWSEDECPGYIPPITTTTAAPCAGFMSFGRCLIISQSLLKWDAARSNCKARGDGWDLLSLASRAMYDDVITSASVKKEYYFIGLYPATSSRWDWTDGRNYDTNEFKGVLAYDTNSDVAQNFNRGVLSQKAGEEGVCFVCLQATQSAKSICML